MISVYSKYLLSCSSHNPPLSVPYCGLDASGKKNAKSLAAGPPRPMNFSQFALRSFVLRPFCTVEH